MRTMGIKIEGRRGYWATIERKHNSPFIEVEILTPEHPNGKQYQVRADCEQAIYATAAYLQEKLDGCEGTVSDIYEYYTALQHFED